MEERKGMWWGTRSKGMSGSISGEGEQDRKDAVCPCMGFTFFRVGVETLEECQTSGISL